MLELLIEAAGWIAALLILGAYILVSLDRIKAQSRAYQWMNAIGAVGFILNSGWHGAIPSTSLNVIWLAVGLLTLWRIGRGTVQQG